MRIPKILGYGCTAAAAQLVVGAARGRLPAPWVPKGNAFVRLLNYDEKSHVRFTVREPMELSDPTATAVATTTTSLFTPHADVPTARTRSELWVVVMGTVVPFFILCTAGYIHRRRRRGRHGQRRDAEWRGNVSDAVELSGGPPPQHPRVRDLTRGQTRKDSALEWDNKRRQPKVGSRLREVVNQEDIPPAAFNYPRIPL